MVEEGPSGAVAAVPTPWEWVGPGLGPAAPRLFSDARPQAATGAARIFLGPRCTVQLASVHRQDGRNRILILPKHGRTPARARYIKQHLPPQVRYPHSSRSGLSLRRLLLSSSGSWALAHQSGEKSHSNWIQASGAPRGRPPSLYNSVSSLSCH